MMIRRYRYKKNKLERTWLLVNHILLSISFKKTTSPLPSDQDTRSTSEECLRRQNSSEEYNKDAYEEPTV